MKLKELLHRIALERNEEFPFPDDLEKYLDDFIPNMLLKSETLQKAFGISGEEMEEIYREGYNYYEVDQYLEASTNFRWLVLLNPYLTKYWMGLAASLQLLEKYEKALHAYAVSALLECDNPYPHFHAYECYVALNNKEDAVKALELAFQRTVGKAAYIDLQKEIKERRHVFWSTDESTNRDHDRNLPLRQ